MRTIGMDHARQSRSARAGFRSALHEKLLIALGVSLALLGLVAPSITTMQGADGDGSPSVLTALAPGLLCVFAALVSLGLRYALFRRRKAQSGSTTRSTRSSSPGRSASPDGKG